MRIRDLDEEQVTESSGYTLKGSFTHDLNMSKIWLVEELAKIAPSVGVIYILGAWWSNLALWLNWTDDIRYRKIINVESDRRFYEGGQRMLEIADADDRTEAMLADANTLDYRQLNRNGVVINCSLHDMPGRDWFLNIPRGTLVVMQARDHDRNGRFDSIADINRRFRLSEILYQGSMDLEDPETRYTRFMVIGRR